MVKSLIPKRVKEMSIYHDFFLITIGSIIVFAAFILSIIRFNVLSGCWISPLVIILYIIGSLILFNGVFPFKMVGSAERKVKRSDEKMKKELRDLLWYYWFDYEFSFNYKGHTFVPFVYLYYKFFKEKKLINKFKKLSIKKKRGDVK